jgi:hypothetical protein
MIKKRTTEQKWHERSEAAKEEAAKLPYGKLKNQLLQKALLPRSVSGCHRRAYSRPGNEQISPFPQWWKWLDFFVEYTFGTFPRNEFRSSAWCIQG